MLIDFYSKRNLKQPNHAPLKIPTQLTITLQGFCLATQDPDIFSTFTAGELRDLFDGQVIEMEKELKVLQHYNLITATDANETRKQYDKLYFKD